jgi:activator of HSP90 ATPase
MKTKTIRQTVLFRASPREVYQALADSRKHSEFTGEKAQISQKIGGKFTAYGDYIEGVNLELEPGKKIVQSWRGCNWESGHFSTVTFLLAKVKGGTRLSFTQVGVPEQFHEDMKQGWKDFYWNRMKAMFDRA